MNLLRLAFLLIAFWLGHGTPSFAADKPASTPAAVGGEKPAYDPTRPAQPAAGAPKAGDTRPAESRPVDARPAEAPIAIPPATAHTRIGPAPVASKSKSFIWEVKSLTNVVYLFGTIHVGKRAFYPLPAQVETAFDNAARLVVEADVSNQTAAGDVSALIGYPESDSLEQNIPAPLFVRLKTQLDRLRIPVAAVQTMKPFFVGGFLSVVEYSRLGYDMTLGVDAYLISRAKQARKPVEELETPRAQLELLSSLPDELQEAFLDNAIAMQETGKAADQVTGMVNAWQSGDARLMSEVTLEVNKGMRDGARLDDILLHSRHDAMVKKIEGYLLGKAPVFVAVGALHLVGPRGLVQILKEKGYEVTQK